MRANRHFLPDHVLPGYVQSVQAAQSLRSVQKVSESFSPLVQIVSVIQLLRYDDSMIGGQSFNTVQFNDRATSTFREFSERAIGAAICVGFSRQRSDSVYRCGTLS